ncbi:MAG: Ig-like domain-containing protein [Propionibacteriaceae bacterium]|nr:Ig-like domain-containing protein [Propionibacteriaceae bacterium]
MTVPFDANSSLTIACDGSEVANYVSPSKPGDYCVGTIVIKDINGSGITGATSYLTPGTQASGDAASVYFRDLAEDTSTDSDGNPSNPGHYKFKVHADVAGSYPINFTYAFGSDLAYTKNGNVPAVFGQPTVDTNKSTHVLNNTADKIANNSDTYTGTITLLSSNDAPVRDGVAQLALAVDPASGYTLSAITCTTVSGKCSGVYTYTIKAAKVGTYEITPTYATGGAAKTLTAQDATFIVTPAQADPASSVFVLGSSTIIEVPSGQPVDVEVATPAQATAQTASVDEGPGYSFHVNVKVWDAGQQNAVPGVTVKAELSGANCDGSAQFETTGGKTASAPSLSDGVAEFTVTSSIATNCTVSVNIVKGGSDEAVAGSVKTLTWVDSTVSLANSYYTVTPATAANAIVADNTETGTIKVTLRDANNFPVTSQAANLTTLPEAGSRITVGNFIHLGNGVYEATWTGKKAGAFDMGVNLSGTALSVQNPSGNGKAYLKPGQPSIVDPFDCDPSDPKTAQGSNLSASPTLVPVDGVSTVKVLITDYYCNPVIDPVVVTFTTDNGQLSASTNSTDANGVSTVTLTDNIARIDTVSASAGGQSVKNATTGTPGLEVEFTATAADPASSLLEAVTSGDKIVGGVEKHAAKATVRDGSSGHNPLPGRAVTFTYRYTDLDGTLRTGTFTADTDASGVATYEFGSNVATVWTITAAIPSGQIPPDAGLQFNFVAGAPDINKSLASFTVGKETVRADGIAQVPAQMKIQDSFGNMISGQSCGFFVTYAGTEGAQFPGGVKALASVGPTGADGVCSTYLTSYYPGAFPVSGTFASVDTPDSQDANFSNLAVDRGTSFWSVAPTAGNSKNPAVSNDNDSYTVTIHLRDANDSPLNKESVTIGYKLTPDGTEQTMTVTSVAPNGVATGFIKTKVAGIYDVRVLTGGDPISTTPGGSTYTQQVTFQAGAPDPIKTAATWQHSTGRVENNGTATHYGTLTVLDAFGNKVPNVTVTFELSHDRNAHFTTTANSGDNIGQGPTNLRSDANGVVTVYVASTSAEVTQINATLVTIGVGTAAFQFGPGAPDVSKSTFVITPTGTRTADGVEAFTGVVTVRDSSGIVVGGYPVSFSVPANVHVMETGPFMTDAITGQVTVHFTSTVSNTYTVNALMASAPVPAADGTTIDQTITFVAGPIDLNVSTYDVTTGKVYADGVATHTGTFVARDAQGNVISGVDVEFNIDEGAAAVPGPVLKFGSGTPSATVTGSTNASGVAQISITSNEPGTFESTAKVGGQPVRGFADLLHRNRAAQFTAGDADTLKSSRNIAPDTDAYPNASVASDGVEQFAITVTVASAKNILVDGAEVRIAGLDSAVTLVEGNATQTTGAANSSTYGTFTWHATSTTSGSFTAYVQVKVGTDWLTVGAPVKLNFAPGEGYPANSWLVEPDPTTKAVADNNATLPVSAYVFDINGNAVTTGTVTFTIPANTTVGSVTGATTVPVAINNGVATINVKSTVAATHQITASQSAGQIMNIKRPTGGGVVASDGIARVTFTHGTADPATSLLSVPTAAGDVTKLADGVDAHTAQVVVRDANTNLVLSGTVTFYYSYTDFAGAQHTGNSGERTIDPGTGIATWDFTSTVAKPWTITATIGGVGGNVNPAPGVVAGFRAGLPDATRTVASLQVGKDSAKADGQANVPAWMIVQDTFGNPVAGYKCGFELTDASDPGAAKFDNASTGAFTKADVGPTSGDGKCAVEIKSFFSGHFPVRGVFDGVKTLNPLPEALFNNQAVSAANSWWSVAADSGNSTTPATANDSDFYLVTVNLRDEDSAIVNNESVDVYYKLTPSSAEQKLTVVSGANGNPAGTATASIKTKAAGIYDVRVSKASNAIATTAGGTTFVQQIEFIAGAPDGTKSFLTSPVGTAKANGQAVQIITATVKDVNGNLIKNRAVQFVIPTGVKSGTTSGQTTVSVNTDNNGVATLPLTSTTPNTYSVTATVLGVAIVSGSPATATFINDDLSLANSTLVLTTSGVLEVRTGFHNVKATLVDAQGNVFTQVREVTFYAKAPGGSLWELLGTANTIDGVADYTFTKIKAGTWQVRAEVTSNSPTGKIGTGADGTVVFPEFKAGPADSIKTAATWTGSRGKVLSNDTDTHYAQVTVLDRDENPVSGVNITFTLSSTHAAHFVDGNGVGLGKTIAPASGPDGVIRVLIASPADEVVPITATLHGVSVVASAGPSTFEFGPDAPNAANSTFAVSPAVGSTKIANGSDAFTGVVTVHDANGLPVGNYTVNFDLPADVALVETAPSAFETDANGQITVHFVSTKAGTYTVNALVGSDHVPTVDRQIEFVAGPIDFNKSYIEVVANGAVANGTATDEMSVHLYDHYDNPVLDGYISFTLPGNVSPVGPAAAVGPSANSGEVVLQVTSTVADEYQIGASVRRGLTGNFDPITMVKSSSGGLASGTTVPVTFVAGAPVAANSVLTVTEAGPMVANNADYYTANVELKDAYSNTVKIAGNSVHFTFSLPGSSVPNVETDALTGANGMASYQFSTAKAGSWSVAGLYGGDEVSNSPRDLVFVAGPFDAAASTFDVTGGKAASDGHDEHRAWAVVTDAQGNPISGVDVMFTIDAGASSVAGPFFSDTQGMPGTLNQLIVRSNADGLAEVFIVSQEPGTFPVTASVNGVTITGNAVTPLNREAQFTSGDPDASKSSRAITPDTDTDPTITIKADNTETYAITVSVRSVFNALVENARVRLVLPSGTPVTLVEGSGETTDLTTGMPGSTDANRAYGQFTWHAKTTKVGSYTGQVQVRVGTDWQDVGAPVLLNFVAGDPSVGPFSCDAGQTGTSFKFAPSYLYANELATGTVKVTDQFCNPIDGAHVTFNTSHGTFDPASGVVTTGPDGTATITLTDTVAHVDTASATVAGLPIAVTGTENVHDTPATTQAVEFYAPPTAPVVDPSNGTQVTGEADPGTEVTVTDEDGNPIEGCVHISVGADGHFSCTPKEKIPDGTEVSVTATDPSGRVSPPTKITIGAISMTLDPPTLYRTEDLKLHGFNFIPGESVTVVLNSTNPVTIGTFIADANGQVTIPAWQVPNGFELGAHTATLTGNKSGPISASFTVLERVVASTGGATTGTTGGAGTGSLSVSVVLLAIAATVSKRKLG